MKHLLRALRTMIQFGAVKLTKNADIDNSQYSSYGTGFDRKSIF